MRRTVGRLAGASLRVGTVTLPIFYALHYLGYAPEPVSFMLRQTMRAIIWARQDATTSLVHDTTLDIGARTVGDMVASVLTPNKETAQLQKGTLYNAMSDEESASTRELPDSLRNSVAQLSDALSHGMSIARDTIDVLGGPMIRQLIAQSNKLWNAIPRDALDVFTVVRGNAINIAGRAFGGAYLALGRVFR